MPASTSLRERVRRHRTWWRTYSNLSRELDSFRTPAERAELDAIVQRHGLTVDELRKAYL